MGATLNARATGGLLQLGFQLGLMMINDPSSPEFAASDQDLQRQLRPDEGAHRDRRAAYMDRAEPAKAGALTRSMASMHLPADDRARQRGQARRGRRVRAPCRHRTGQRSCRCSERQRSADQDDVGRHSRATGHDQQDDHHRIVGARSCLVAITLLDFSWFRVASPHRSTVCVGAWAHWRPEIPQARRPAWSARTRSGRWRGRHHLPRQRAGACTSGPRKPARAVRCPNANAARANSRRKRTPPIPGAVEALALGLGAATADNDVSYRISKPFVEHLDHCLRNSYNMSLDKLQAALVAVGKNASVINSGAAEIRSAADDLARRTEPTGCVAQRAVATG